jgi:hypothetical protein
VSEDALLPAPPRLTPREDPVPASEGPPAAPPAPPPVPDEPPPVPQSSDVVGCPWRRRSNAFQNSRRTASCHVEGRSPRVRYRRGSGNAWSRPSARSQASTTIRPRASRFTPLNQSSNGVRGPTAWRGGAASRCTCWPVAADMAEAVTWTGAGVDCGFLTFAPAAWCGAPLGGGG